MRSPAPSTSGSPLATWVLAARPKTLWAAFTPVLVGTALALEAGLHHWPSAGVALLAALLIQIGTNFSNDYLDYVKGADTSDRKGPLRVTQAGLVSAAAMRRATFFVFALAFVTGLYLVHRGGWPVLLIGVLSIVAGVLYTAGRFSLAYLGLADVAVLVFFGPVAVAGTYYVQALTVTPDVILAGLGPGLLATAILLVNNVRDVEEDRTAQKRTLVVRFGRRFGESLYAACIVLAGLLPVGLVLGAGAHPGTLLAAAVIPVGYPLLRQLRAEDDPAVLNHLLGRTGQLMVLYGVLFSVGLNF